MLLSIINARYVSTGLVTIYQGFSFVNFNLFDPLLALLPASVKGEDSYNVLDDNTQYHPYIFSVSMR